MTLDLQTGATFGEYVLERRLGGGGFGDVWLAKEASGGQVALKVLHGQYQSSEAARLRAEIELLAAAASSRSSHIVRVLGGGSEPAPYVVMEYIEGTDLGREILRRGALPVDEVLRIAEGIADALATLQQAGIIHRDIKPANVMIDTQGVVKLTDFGIAKIVGVDTITTTNNIAMSVAYAAPEVFEGQSSYACDYYAFGALLFHLLSGRTLFQGNYATVMRHHMMSPPDLNGLPSDTPLSLRTLIGDCLAKTPEARPADAFMLSKAVKAAMDEVADSLDPTLKQTPLREPSKLGPWLIDSRSDQDDWTFVCHHEATGNLAVVELHFSDELRFRETLRRMSNIDGRVGSGRLILRPGEDWNNRPPGEFLFWDARVRSIVESSSLPTGILFPPLKSTATGIPDKSRGAFILVGLGLIVAFLIVGIIGLKPFAGGRNQPPPAFSSGDQASPTVTVQFAARNLPEQNGVVTTPVLPLMPSDAPTSSTAVPSPRATVIPPTSTPRVNVGPTEATVIPPTSTPRVNVGPTDLVLSRISLLPDGRVSVTIGNRGPGDLIGKAVFVTVRDLTLRGEVLSVQVASLPVGGVVTLESTTFRIDRETDLQAIVDPYGNVTDPDRSNNQISTTLAPGQNLAPVPALGATKVP